MLFDSTYLVMLYFVTQCYFWLLSESVFKLSVICAKGSCVELCRAVLSVLCELYLRCHKLLLSDLSKWYQAVVLDNWQDPLHTHIHTNTHNTYTYTHIHTHSHTHAHTHMHTHTYTHMQHLIRPENSVTSSIELSATPYGRSRTQ